MVNLTALTVRHFVPSAKFYCISFYKKNIDEYKGQEPLHSFIENTFIPTAFVNPEDKPHDHIDSKKTSGFENKDNAKYFTEGYNAAFEKFKDLDEKVLLLAEDHFFTTGQTLREITQSDFDVAYAPWDHEDDANGAVICFNFKKLNHLFPLPISHQSVEAHIRDHVIHKASNPYKLTSRKHANYFGDGIYTNSSEEMIRHITAAGIL